MKGKLSNHAFILGKSYLYVARASQSAFTLFELLISLAIFMTLVAISGDYLRNTAISLMSINKKLKQQNQEAIAGMHLARCLRTRDSLRLAQSIIIHKNGKIRDTSGKQVSFSRKSQPSPDSDAISCMEFQADTLLAIHEIDRNGEYVSVKACQLYSANTSKSASAEEYLSISIDGVEELRKIEDASAAGPGCIKLNLRAVSGFTATSSGKAYIPRILIPIRDSYTLYVSASHQLRRITHWGGEIVENQPLMNFEGELKLSFQEIKSDGLNILPVDATNAEFFRDGDFSVKHQYVGMLGKIDNFFLVSAI